MYTSPTASSDFSLVAGGPLYHLWRRTRLSGDDLQLTRRRMLVIALLAWVPLLLLSMTEGHAWGSSVTLTFLKDLETHAKLLIAVPLLIGAEVMAHKRLPFVIRQFLERGMIPDAVRARFDAALASAVRLRNSFTAELLLVLFVYLVGIPLIWRTQSALDMSSWYGAHVEKSAAFARGLVGGVCESADRPVPAGALVLQVVHLGAIPMAGVTHATEPGADSCRWNGRPAFSRPIETRLHAALARPGRGAVGNDRQSDTSYTGAKLLSFKVELVTTVAVMVLVVLGPLSCLHATASAIRRIGLEEIGAVATISGEFERQWFRGGAAPGEALVGSSDIQSLADLRGSFLIVRGIRVTPFSV